MTMKTRKFDAAAYLDSEEAIAAYLDDALASRDSAQISQAIGTAARAKGMAIIAKKTNLGRQSLYKALSANGNPSFDSILRVIDALGLKLTAQIHAKPAARIRRRAVIQSLAARARKRADTALRA